MGHQILMQFVVVTIEEILTIAIVLQKLEVLLR